MEFNNLKRQYKILKKEIDEHIAEIMADARFLNGEEIKELEKKLADYVGTKYCVSCGSGTDALMLSFLVYGVGKGDAIFCPDMTYIASVDPGCIIGASPVFVDIDSKTYNMDPRKLEEAILKVKKEGKLKAKAVVAVDFLGNPAALDEISEICKKHDVILIEDAAQSFGSTYKGKKCGAFGDIACTSFFPTKPLGCYGDGGAIFTNDEEIVKLLESYKAHGKGKEKYDNIRIGIGSRINTIQAAVLLHKFDLFDKELETRQNIAKKYDDSLKDILEIQELEEGAKSAYAQYAVLARNNEERNYIIEKLKENEIPAMIYYPKGMHKMKVFEEFSEGDFTNSDRYADCNICIPFSPYLREDEQELVIETIRKAVLEKRK